MDYKVNETSLVIYSYENCSSLKISPIITPWHVEEVQNDSGRLLSANWNLSNYRMLKDSEYTGQAIFF